MPIKALNPFAPHWYTPTFGGNDKEPEDKATAFEIAGLDGEQLRRVQEYYRRDPETGRFIGIAPRGEEYALEYGLKGWRNFVDDAGRAVAYHPANFRVIPPGVRSELALEIVYKSEVPETERKN